MSLNTEEFSLEVHFRDGKCEHVLRRVDAETVVKRALAVSRSRGAQRRDVTDILITDDKDNTVLHWRCEDGLVFPLELEGRNIFPTYGRKRLAISEN